MEPDTFNYQLLGVHTIGGPSGDYFFDPEMPTAEWLEFRVLSVANGAQGPTYVQISAHTIPTPLAWDGTKTINNANSYPNLVYALGASAPPIVPTPWIQVIDQPKRIFIRIDTPGANTACYVSLQCRAKTLKRVPAPFVTVHPSDEQLVHKERERRIQQAVLGTEGERKDYATRPTAEPRVREFTTGTPTNPILEFFRQSKQRE